MLFGKKNNLKSLSDAELLTEFPNRETAVLAEFFKRYRVLSFGLCIKYLKNREQAKDAVSEIFLGLRYDLSKHKVQNFRSWFYVYCKNHCLGMLRKEKASKKHLSVWEFEKYLNIESEYLDEPDILRINAAINGLKPEQQKCIRSFYFDKHSYIETSALLDITEKQVKSHLQNAKRNLRIALEKESSSKHQNRGI